MRKQDTATFHMHSRAVFTFLSTEKLDSQRDSAVSYYSMAETLQTPSTIAVRLSACLTLWILDPQPIDFCLSSLSACEYAGSRDFAFVGAVEISSLRLRYERGRGKDKDREDKAANKRD